MENDFTQPALDRNLELFQDLLTDEPLADLFFQLRDQLLLIESLADAVADVAQLGEQYRHLPIAPETAKSGGGCRDAASSPCNLP